jgi:hypothetical protein
MNKNKIPQLVYAETLLNVIELYKKRLLVKTQDQDMVQTINDQADILTGELLLALNEE